MNTTTYALILRHAPPPHRFVGYREKGQQTEGGQRRPLHRFPLQGTFSCRSLSANPLPHQSRPHWRVQDSLPPLTLTTVPRLPSFCSESRSYFIPLRTIQTIYADSRAALSSAFNPKPHPAQYQSIQLILAPRQWLHLDASRTIDIRWCPSHSGVTMNEAVDEICKLGRARSSWSAEVVAFVDNPSSRQRSIGFAKQTATTDASAAWLHHLETTDPLRPSLLKVKIRGKVPFTTPSYRHGGGPFMRILRTGKLDVDKKENRQRAVRGNLSTDSTSAALTAAESSQLTRCLTNHAPIGAYRTRFHPKLPTRCPTCPCYVQTRDHILFHCIRYRPPRSFTWFTHISKFLAHDDSFDLLVQWLRLHPLAFSFAHSPPMIQSPTFGYGARFHPTRPPD